MVKFGDNFQFISGDTIFNIEILEYIFEGACGLWFMYFLFGTLDFNLIIELVLTFRDKITIW